MEGFPYSATLNIPFKSHDHAVIAARTLNVDGDLKPNESTSTFAVSDAFLVFSVQAKTAKHLKKAITTTMPSIELIERTIEAFTPE
jgi:EKC/KEOPS complex subunit PCC1/LAGE3